MRQVRSREIIQDKARRVRLGVGNAGYEVSQDRVEKEEIGCVTRKI